MSKRRPLDQENHRVISIRPVTFSGEDNQSIVANEAQLIEDRVGHARAELVRINGRKDQTLQKIKEDLAAAEHQIQQAREDWQAEREALIMQTKEEAFQVGYADGEQKAYQTRQADIDQANQILNVVKSEKLKLLAEYEADIISLVMTIAKKVIRTELDQAAGLSHLVSQALKELNDEPFIKIHASTEDFMKINNHYKHFKSIVDQRIVLTIHPNDQLGKGDCLIETPHAKLDISIDVQLKKIEKCLVELMEEFSREDNQLY
ncbi:FliH/SctL family protein [Amphibacillus marinus]|uniref:FliH/SctL family protein n=1 Tax=Amphibacillus marinus TaxID=872970 RepID=UPI0015A6DDFA|nr:FliH/SctL family protein [Amphibacillus marinus]